MWPIRICAPFVNQFCVNSPPLLQIKQSLLPGKSLRSSIFIGTMTAAATSADTSLARIAPIEAVLFDVDGTLCDTDPIHHRAFIELLQVPISEDFYINNIAGKHNKEIAELFFPGDIPRGIKFTDDKEALFRKLYKVTKWVEDRGLKRAAVTNAPKLNAELAISKLGLSDFFQAVILGDECEHAKPHPEPYQKALEVLQVSKDHTFVIRAGVAAGMPVIGLTTGNPEHLLMKANPTFLIKNYDDPKLWAALEEVDRVSGKQPSG
ncbi:Haloacid dehalogenase-like hydrolase domain-containing protein Sgpp [Linum perenne]